MDYLLPAITAFFLLATIPSWAVITLSSCGDVSQNDGYNLMTDLSSTATCLTVHDLQSFELNCQSHAITVGAGAAGIVLTNTPKLALDSCIMNPQGGSAGTGFNLSMSPGANLFFTRGMFGGAVIFNGSQVTLIHGNTFLDSAGQSCSNNPMLCGSPIPPPIITSPSTAAGTVGTPFTFSVTAAPTDSSSIFYAQSLPAGLSMDTLTGVISGVPTAVATSVVSLSVSNAGGNATSNLTLTVGPALSICDVNQDHAFNVSDVEISVNQALQILSCTSDINSDGVCNVIDVQRVVNAALGGPCVTR